MAPNKLQLWLSPRPARRSNVANDLAFKAVDDSALVQFTRDEETGNWYVVETHYISNKLAREGNSGPPLHIHFKQTEFFEVQQGVMAVQLNNTQLRLTKESGRATIPLGARHRFWVHPDSTEDLAFKCWVDPFNVDNSFDEGFIRNFVNYVSDCAKEKVEPSIPQLALMAIDHGTVFTPPFWVPLWVLLGLHHVVGYWIGASLLGYQPSYAEYSVGPRNPNGREPSKDL